MASVFGEFRMFNAEDLEGKFPVTHTLEHSSDCKKQEKFTNFVSEFK